MKEITVLIEAAGNNVTRHNQQQFTSHIDSSRILNCSAGAGCEGALQGERPLIRRGDCLRWALESCRTRYLMLVLKPEALLFGAALLGRMVEGASRSGAPLVYGAHERVNRQASVREAQPLIDCQEGAVRDDFDFGTVVLLDVGAARRAVEKYPQLLPHDVTGWYGLRLALSLERLPLRIEEPLYQVLVDYQKDDEREHFSYVDPANRDYQRRLEAVFTEYARNAGFFLPRRCREPDFNSVTARVEASVVIPVRNREGTVADAVQSAAAQRTRFPFNVIVVDNHSTDRTSPILATLAAQNPRIKHVIPGEQGLGIGGCWNLALQHPECGRFAVQLDSDDLYSGELVLQRVVDAFYEQRCAALVGAYTIVDKRLSPIPPGLIDHREWNEENGHNNGLRINGFGAPRAFFAPVARAIGFPDVSYGEDYAMMLAITRHYKLGRIYDSLYWCRRWEGNSDAGLTIEKANRYNLYKDGLRTAEIRCRKELNHEQCNPAD